MQAQSYNTTLCYIRANGQTLLIQRAKKDSLHGMWIAPGGKFDHGETPEECAIRKAEMTMADSQQACFTQQYVE